MRRWLGLLIGPLALGCVSTSVQRLDHAVRPARSPEAVAVLQAQPQQPYTVIAFLTARGRTVFDGFDDLQRDMVAHAAKLGGEALILGPASTDSEFVLTGVAMIRSDRRTLTGLVIVYP